MFPCGSIIFDPVFSKKVIFSEGRLSLVLERGIMDSLKTIREFTI